MEWRRYFWAILPLVLIVLLLFFLSPYDFRIDSKTGKIYRTNRFTGKVMYADPDRAIWHPVMEPEGSGATKKSEKDIDKELFDKLENNVAGLREGLRDSILAWALVLQKGTVPGDPHGLSYENRQRILLRVKKMLKEIPDPRQRADIWTYFSILDIASPL